MKKCPVCEAIAFDDQPVCYGCLHSYEDDGAASADAALGDAFPNDVLTADPAEEASEATRRPDVEGCDAFAQQQPDVRLPLNDGERLAALRDGPVSFVIRFEPYVDAQGALELRCTIS